MRERLAMLLLQLLWPHLVAFLGRVRRVVEDLADEGLQLPQPSSFGRSLEHNAAIGGHPESQHVVWLAIDYPVMGEAAERLVQRARAHGLVAIDEGDHVHIQAFPHNGKPHDVVMATWALRYLGVA